MFCNSEKKESKVRSMSPFDHGKEGTAEDTRMSHTSPRTTEGHTGETWGFPIWVKSLLGDPPPWNSGGL